MSSRARPCSTRCRRNAASRCTGGFWRRFAPRRRPDGLARLAHHAEMAGDRDAVLAYAPAAARRAAEFKAHREAAAQYARALRWIGEGDPAERAPLLEGLAYQCYLTDRHAEAVDAWTEALAIWRQAGIRSKKARSCACCRGRSGIWAAALKRGGRDRRVVRAGATAAGRRARLGVQRPQPAAA